MSKRKEETSFLRQLMQAHHCDQCQQLQSRINKVERDEGCIRSALLLALALVVVSVAGLGYSAVLIPEFFDNSTPFAVQAFTVLFIASTISLLGFICVWWWYRRLCNTLYQRMLIAALQNSKAAPTTEFVSIPAPQ
jgi:hypothetical protein